MKARYAGSWFVDRHPAVRLWLLALASLGLSLAGSIVVLLAIDAALLGAAPRAMRGLLTKRWVAAQLLLFPGLLVVFGLAALDGNADVLSSIGWTLEAFRYGLRLGGLLLASLVLVRTLSSRDLLALLRLLRVPATIAMLFAMVMRFVPEVMEETRRVVRAQSCRGWRLRGPASLSALVVPLIVGAMKRAHETSIAIEVRQIEEGTLSLPCATVGDWVIALAPCSAPIGCWILS